MITIVMPGQIKESDWKLLSKLRTDALKRFCQRILSAIDSINADHAMSKPWGWLPSHEQAPSPWMGEGWGEGGIYMSGAPAPSPTRGEGLKCLNRVP
ncbi:MAG: hypothetical protein A2V79_07865 [Betaproteobacteria bacterium RBG_16_56_24]|nr:MAG: hypothetical protein A2V79_07865 [Betaproteobacteria bacterium RBG_16_56_24]